MGLFDFLRNTKDEPTDKRGVEALIPLRSVTTVSLDTALTLGAVYRCINIIATSISQCPISVFRNDVEPISIPSFIAQPTVGKTQGNFFIKPLLPLP